MLVSLINIDVQRRIGQIDPRIYGGFIEHLGKCIYGGIYDPHSPHSDERGLRTDVIEAIRKLRTPIVRWPGGNFASGYHWQDGIGPQAQRPTRPELAWGTVESNQFGTDEFIQWCRMVDTEPYICANLGTGTLDEAAQWVEYCNGSDDTYFANLRRHNGHEQAYGVKYWGLGNEVYGDWQLGHRSAQDYAKVAREFGKMMKRTDPSIKLVACGGQNLDWDREVLSYCADLIDYLSYHVYWCPQPDADPYYSLFWGPHGSEQYLRFIGELIEYIRRERGIGHSIAICADEWNVWYRSDVTTERELYNLTDALVVGTFLNVLQRNCNTVKIANIAQLVNVIAPIWADPESIFLQTIYWPLFAAANYSGPVALDVHCESDGFEAPAEVSGELPYLDVSATLDEQTSKLFISVVNRHKQAAIPADIQMSGAQIDAEGTVHLITGEEPSVTNSFEEPDNVALHSEPSSVAGDSFAHEFPAHSMTILELPLC